MSHYYSKPRVVVLSIHPAPYRDPMFIAVHRRGNIDLRVLTMFDEDVGHSYWDIDQPTYPNTFLGKGYRLRQNMYFHPRLLPMLRDLQPDVVCIPGYNHATSLAAFVYCQISRTTIIYCMDSILNRPSDTTKRRSRDWLVRYIFSVSSAIIVPGTAAIAYAMHYGVRPESVFQGLYTLDYDQIRKDVDIAQIDREELRDQLGIKKNNYVFLMTANMIHKREHWRLIEAFEKAVTVHPNIHLVLIGVGSQRQLLKEMARKRKFHTIHFLSAVPFRDLAKWYAISDAYIHSGWESYSTALAYAAIAGLPIVSTTAVGATADYVHEGETGYLIDRSDVNGMAERMLLLATHPERAIIMGKQATVIANRRTVQWAAEQFELAVRFARKEYV